jgi:DNA-binding NarL/FixJ family response regulator
MKIIKEKLTETEMIVLKFLAMGYNNFQISQKIFSSVHTVKAHVTSILKKLDAQNRTEAAYIAFKNNLLDE